ncbi:MAG: eL32 family ribosomal protein [archaeon]|jgi:large subunit ribosomal protein L32e|nr:eL32 family ribosomal protein [archaeon]
MARQFLRAETPRWLRLGKNRRKLRKWRRPRGKSNKIRLGRAGHPVGVSVGFKTPRKEAGRVLGLIPRLVHNIRELESLTKENAAILARIGAKKKIELIKRADELKIKVLNLGGKK